MTHPMPHISENEDEDAEALHRENVEARRRILGHDHPSTLTPIDEIGSLFKAQTKLAYSENVTIDPQGRISTWSELPSYP